MQPKTILSVLSIAIAASARPSPQTSTDTCDAPNSVACCNGIATNGTGLGCIFSTLNIIPACTSGSALSCCNGPQTGLINIQCVPISIVL